jgi:hypothetical protein
MSGPRDGPPLKDEISFGGFERLGNVLREVMKEKEAKQPTPLCVVCNKPLDLRACVTDDHGQPVHPNCALRSTSNQHSS